MRALLAAPTWPIRLARRRMGVQLIASYVLVVFLTTVVLEAMAVATILGRVPDFLLPAGLEINFDVDYSLGEKARATSLLVEDEVSGATPAGGDEPSALAALDAALARVVRGASVGSDCDERTGDWDPTMVICGVAHALVTDADGVILASSDPNWGAPGQPIETVAFLPAVLTTVQAIALQGKPADDYLPYVLDEQDRVTAASYPLLDARGQLVGVVTLESVPFDVLAGLSMRELLWEVIRGNRTIFPYIAVPALLVAIPVGIWRARAVSRRVSRLAAAADAMAAGDLSRRVPVKGEDEISRLSERFNEMSARLGASDQARRAFVANVSHDLRTPVAIIQGHLERLLEPVPKPPHPAIAEPEEETLGIIHRETITLSRLIEDLFTLARLEETALPLETGPVPIGELTAQAVASLQTLAWEQRRVAVQSMVPPDLPPALADRTRVRQILHNLLYNALRHTPEGGLIIVDAAERDAMIEVSITDTGVGISPEELESIFERFYRGGEGNGTGLGLHIVKQLVEAQRGTVSAESRPGVGTTFRFTLPRAR